jgi:hypothetical protein
MMTVCAAPGKSSASASLPLTPTHRRLGAFLHFAALGLAALGLDASWYVPSVPPAIGVSGRTPCSEMSVGRLAGFLGFRFQVVQASCFLLLSPFSVKETGGLTLGMYRNPVSTALFWTPLRVVEVELPLKFRSRRIFRRAIFV